MAIISTNMTTNEYEGKESFDKGHYEIKILAGLDENIYDVLGEAAERTRVLLETLPPEKRYSRF